MAQLTAQLRTPWVAAAALWSTRIRTPWAAAAALWSTGGPYTPPPPPGGGTPTAPSDAAAITVTPANAYNLVHTLEVRDLRDGQVLPVEAVSIATDRGSVFWTLRATGGPQLYTRLSTGEQPPRVRVTLDGAQWEFVVEAVLRTRQHAAAQITIEGRSLAAAAGSPYESERLWAVDGDTTAAQIAAAANLYTELDVQWQLDDWPVPDGVFSLTATPLAVVQRVAEAGGGLVKSLRVGYGVTVRPQYTLLPNEWALVAPDLELPLAVLEEESFRVTDQPAYDGVVVAGQQQGAVALVRLAGTTGGNQAPMVTDPLITDGQAARQRGQAILGRSGKQQEHLLRLPLVMVGGVAVVPDEGQLVRVMDSPPWVGMVTAVQLSAQLPTATLALTLERHTEVIAGTAAPPPPAGPPLSFTPSIADITVAGGGTVDVSVASRWSGGAPPYTYSLRSGSLPAWLNLDATLGRLSGTAPTTPGINEIALRATDAVSSTADSNEFSVEVTAGASDLVRANFNGANGQTSGVANAGTAGGNFVLGDATSLQSAAAFSGTTGLRHVIFDNAATPAELTPTSLIYTNNTPLSFELRFRVANRLGDDAGLWLAANFAAWDLGQISSVPRFLIQAFDIANTNFLTLMFLATGSATPLTVFGSVVVPKATFHHVAMSRDAGGVYRAFLNGAPVGTTVSESTTPGLARRMGLFLTTDGASSVHIGVAVDVESVRVRLGTAYNGSFVPEDL